MPYVIIKDWQRGLLTFDLIVILRKKYGFGLKEAKSAVEELVSRRGCTTFKVSEDKIEECIADMSSLKVVYEVINSDIKSEI